MFPSSGAEYEYLKKAFPQIPSIAFLTAMVLIFAGTAITSTVALAFAGYLKVFFELNIYVAAIILMSACTIINNYGIDKSNKVNILLTLIELSGLLIVIWFGFSTSRPISGPTLHIHKGTFIASSIIFFVYLGFEEIVHLAEEAKNATRDIPKAIFLSLLLTSIIYLCISIAITRLTLPESLSNSMSPLADVLKNEKHSFSILLSIIALFATANTVLVSMLVNSRVIFSMSRDGDLPGWLSVTSSNFLVPKYASYVVLIISCLFLLLTDIETLASFSSFATLVTFIMINVAVIVLRYKISDFPRPFLIPFNLGKFPVIPIFGILIGVIMCMQYNVAVYLSSILVICLSAFIYSTFKK